MKVYELRPGETGSSALRIAQRAMPTLGVGEVLVRMRAASLNYRDLLVSRQPTRTEPRIPLSDGAGEVIERHAAVTRFQAGDRVMPIFYPDWIEGAPTAGKQVRSLGGPVDGVLAEYVAVHEDCLVRVPEHLSFEEAATLPCAGVTAWHALFERTPLRPGSTVSMLGTGGLSTFALQFARAVGARAAVVSGSEDKWDAARRLGAQHLVNYRQMPEWSRSLLDWTQGEGVENVLDAGGPRTLDQSVAAARVGGNVSVMGVLGGMEGAFGPMPILLKQLNLRGIYVGSREMFERLAAFLATTGIKPVVHATFGFEEAPRAYEEMVEARHVGKLVIAI